MPYRSYPYIFLLLFVSVQIFGQQSHSIFESQLLNTTSPAEIDVLIEKLDGYAVTHSIEHVERLNLVSDVSKKLNYSKGRFEICYRIGKIYAKRGEYSNAVEKFKEALELSEEGDDLKQKALANRLLGSIYTLDNQYESAIFHLKKSIKLSLLTDDFSGLAKSYNSIAALYERGLRDQVTTLDYLHKAAEIYKDQKDHMSRAFVMVNIAVVNDQLENYEEAYRDFIFELKSKLSKHAKGLKSDRRQSVLRELKDMTLSTDRDWDRFKTLYDSVYPNFFIPIKRSLPNLTEGDLRLIALINLDLSLETLSRNLGITKDGVRKSKYRLRKKLDTKDEQALRDFIHQFAAEKI